MNIIEFKDIVYDRIVMQYMKDVRKRKPSSKDWWSVFFRFSSPIIIFILSFNFYNPYAVGLFNGIWGAVMTISFVMFIFISLASLFDLKKLLFFKSGSNKFWRTNTSSKPFLGEESLKSYLSKYSHYYCRKEYSNDAQENLTHFKVEEIELMKKIYLNTTQKEVLYEIVKSGREINFYDLDKLIDNSDQNINRRNLLEKEKESEGNKNNKNKLILESFKCDKELEMEMGSSLKKQKKYLL